MDIVVGLKKLDAIAKIVHFQIPAESLFLTYKLQLLLLQNVEKE
jgi:hypothetical protein